DVDQPFQTAQIDEGAEIAHGRDGALQLRADLQPFAQLGSQRGTLLLEQRAAGQDRVSTADLPDAELEALPHELRLILDEPDVDLRSGDEAAHPAQIDFQAAFVLPGHQALDRDLRVERLLQHLAAGPLGNGARDHHDALGYREQVSLERLAGVDEQIALLIAQLAQISDPFALASQVEEGDLRSEMGHARRDLLSHAELSRFLLVGFREERGDVGVLFRRRLGVHRARILARLLAGILRRLARVLRYV